VERCLAHDPKDRPQAAAEVAAALRRPLSGPRRAVRRLRGHLGKVLAAAVVVLGVGLATGYALVPRGSYSERQAERGLDAYRHGQYDEAVEHLNRALDADPDLARAWFLRGRAHQSQGQFGAALGDFGKAYRLAPDGRTLACMGYCANQLHLHGEAALYYRQAIEAGFAPPAVHNNLGYSYLQLRKLDQAEDSLNQALGLDGRLQAATIGRWSPGAGRPHPPTPT
jgi:tetratricopeptide (TPR) repeat protein